jgi:MtN3 and saliva related transmembrane protein
MVEVIGWVSSLVLVATIARQVQKQWREKSSKGVSKWLFVGQLAASVGFVIYSALIQNWVFVVTNGLMVCNALAGFLIVRKHRKDERAASG